MAKSMIHVAERGVPCSLESAREAVSEIYGVHACETNHITHTLTVEYDQDTVTLGQIMIEIKKSLRGESDPKGPVSLGEN